MKILKFPERRLNSRRLWTLPTIKWNSIQNLLKKSGTLFWNSNQKCVALLLFGQRTRVISTQSHWFWLKSVTWLHLTVRGCRNVGKHHCPRKRPCNIEHVRTLWPSLGHEETLAHTHEEAYPNLFFFFTVTVRKRCKCPRTIERIVSCTSSDRNT